MTSRQGLEGTSVRRVRQMTANVKEKARGQEVVERKPSKVKTSAKSSRMIPYLRFRIEISCCLERDEEPGKEVLT